MYVNPLSSIYNKSVKNIHYSGVIPLTFWRTYVKLVKVESQLQTFLSFDNLNVMVAGYLTSLLPVDKIKE
jgi:hypothetical protein